MGLLSDLIGNAALTGHNMLSRENKAKQDEEAAMRANDRQLAKSKELADHQAIAARVQEEFKDALKAKRERLDSEKLAQQEGQIEDKATQTGLTRDAGTMTAGAAGLPPSEILGDDGRPLSSKYAGQAVSPEEIANLPPAARVAYEKAGLLQSPLASQASKDRLDAARTVGADHRLVTSYQGQVKSDTADEKAQAALDFRGKQLAQKETEGQERLRISDKRADAAIAAASRSGQPKPAKEGELNDVQRAELGDLSAALRDARSVLRDATTKKAIAAAQANVDDAQKAYSETLTSFGGKSPKKADPSPKDVGKSSVSTLPKGAVQIGTSGGKPVYQTPDGKKFKAD